MEKTNLAFNKNKMARDCPDCGEALVIREDRGTGKKFYGCSAFPECDYTEEINEFVEGWDERQIDINRK